MVLFKMQDRPSPNVANIIAKIREEETNKSKISVKKGTLLNELKEIELNVKTNLGDYHPILLDSNEKWIEYCNNIGENGVVSLDTETSGLSFKDQTEGLAGVCIKSIGQTEAYAPVGHISSITEQPLSNQVSKESIKQGFEIMNKKHCRYVFHNAYYDLIVLKAVLGYFPKVYWDTLVAAAMLNENEPHSLKVLYDKYVMEGKVGVHKFAELFDGIPFNRISPKVGYYYSAHDCLMTEQLYLFQKPYLTVGTEECDICHLEGVSKVFHTEEIPLIEVLADMKWRGIQIDIEMAYKLKEKYEKLQKEALEKFNEAVSPLEDKIKFYIKQHAGTQLEYPINYNSPVQIKILFYEIINTGVIFEKEPNGTGKHVLDKILTSPKYENTQLKKIARALVDVKKYDKALGTFINKLIDLAESDKNHVVRPDFNSTRTRTGRLSSSGDFNIQQLPSHMGDIRNMFYAGDNKVLILCDYSRQEVAVCAAVSGDEKMIQAFRDGIDIYSHVASLAFNVPYKDCCEFNDDGTTNKEGKERRSKAKAIVLGILYSKGVKAIGEDLHVTTEKAQEIYDSVMKAFPDMHQWLQDVQNFAKKNGYIDGFYGRRRRLPELLLDDYEFTFGKEYNEASQEFYKEDFINRLSHSKRTEKQQIINYAHKHNITIIDNTGKKAKALREVANSIIQGSSADICKIALNSIYRDEVMRKYDAKLVMSIHDEQGVICDAQYADEVAKRLEYLAIKAASALPFNLTCDVTIEQHWYMGDFNV